MGYLTDKFKGKYRILCPVDETTNDFPRKLNGSYEDVDCYISCQHGNKVLHYGHNILMAYIPSLGRGNNIIKAINETNSNMIFDIEKTDSEVLFKFKYTDSNKILPLLKPRTLGSGISPYSSKNRPKTVYIIPDEDLVAYKQILSKIPKEDILSLTHTTKKFIKTLETKRNTMAAIKSDMKRKGLRNKEYIHSINKWNDYIEYLKTNL